MDFVAGSGETDIEEAAVLSQLCVSVGSVVRQNAFFEERQDDNIELKAFGRVKGHQIEVRTCSSLTAKGRYAEPCETTVSSTNLGQLGHSCHIIPKPRFTGEA